VKNGGKLPHDEQLAKELTSTDAFVDESNKLCLEPKRNVSAKLGEGQSPDSADACALTVAMDFALVDDDDGRAAELQKRLRIYRETGVDPGGSGSRDYDPLEAG